MGCIEVDSILSAHCDETRKNRPLVRVYANNASGHGIGYQAVRLHIYIVTNIQARQLGRIIRMIKLVLCLCIILHKILSYSFR